MIRRFDNTQKSTFVLNNLHVGVVLSFFFFFVKFIRTRKNDLWLYCDAKYCSHHTIATIIQYYKSTPTDTDDGYWGPWKMVRLKTSWAIHTLMSMPFYLNDIYNIQRTMKTQFFFCLFFFVNYNREIGEHNFSISIFAEWNFVEWLRCWDTDTELHF